MALPREIASDNKDWLDEKTDLGNVVVTSRARLARNLANHLFAPHAPPNVLAEVLSEIDHAFASQPSLRRFLRLDLEEATENERVYLKESRLISREMESSGENRVVYVGRDLRSSVMVNEEDHLRLQCFAPGLQIGAVQKQLGELDAEIGEVVDYAFHEHLGFLTACPTNVGTGLRVSVMMHLPGLTMRRQLEKALQPLGSFGLTARGFHGEHSENTGDFFQISNEVTLGKSVMEIEQSLAEVASSIIEKELEARSLLATNGGIGVKDAIWRSYGILTHARKIDSAEAMKLLSRIRLGIDQNLFEGLTHEKLNRLVTEIQPGHLICRHGAPDESESRDAVRADLIRKYFATGNGSKGP